jgi:hypothetical protein
VTQKQRSYQAFVKGIKASKGLSHKEAQAAYRAMGERLGRSPAKADLARHPRISSQVSKQAQTGQAPPSKREAKEIARREAETRSKRSEAARRGHETRKAREAAQSAQAAPSAPKLNGLPAVPTTVRDLAQWDVYGYDYWEGADYEDFHAGGEYEYTD